MLHDTLNQSTGGLEKSVGLITSSLLFSINDTLLYIKGLTSEYGGQFKPAAHGQGFRYFQGSDEFSHKCFRVMTEQSGLPKPIN